MAAVAAEPGAAPTTTGPGDQTPQDRETPGHPQAAAPEPEEPRDEQEEEEEAVALEEEDGAAAELRHGRPQPGDRPPSPGDRPSSPGDRPLSPGPGPRFRSVLDPQVSAVFLLSLPPPRGSDAGLSLAEPAEPSTGSTDRPEPRSRAQNQRSPGQDLDPDPARGSRSPQGPQTQDKPELDQKENLDQTLDPGSEVRVSLDHVIDDALVVSFRVGERVFSGVLMDVTKR